MTSRVAEALTAILQRNPHILAAVRSERDAQADPAAAVEQSPASRQAGAAAAATPQPRSRTRSNRPAAAEAR